MISLLGLFVAIITLIVVFFPIRQRYDMWRIKHFFNQNPKKVYPSQEISLKLNIDHQSVDHLCRVLRERKFLVFDRIQLTPEGYRKAGCDSDK